MGRVYSYAMHVAAVQYEIAWEDMDRNHDHVRDLLTTAQLPPHTFVVLPEFCDTGFSFNLDAIAQDDDLAWARHLARDLELWLQVGYATRGGEDDRGFNCAGILSPTGETVGTYRKIHPFSFGKEHRVFSGGSTVVIRPVGEVLASPLICYDLRFPEVWRIAAGEGAEVFSIGANWPRERSAHWTALLLARAIENQAAVIAANRIGRDPSYSYEGGSMIIDHSGAILADAGTRECVIEADLELDDLRAWRQDFPALRDIRSRQDDAIDVDAVDHFLET